ncbi:zinc-binding dehydrogenase [Nocardioides sp. CBS4Y-1]|uniref:Zinc-binding dehydrogenase n=2 Tax=Nocardioides acrostichi TaxID=2784339 RepID=A0A930YB77_9ACTN|nr:zinc-binding dehydrogenase [Nocardioides acrostichi]
MRAAVITGHGGLEVIEVREVATPHPGPGEVLVRVAAAGCNNTDVWTREGAYGHDGADGEPGGWLGPLDFPRIQGGDVTGTVVACGDGVPPELVAGRVLLDPALYDDDGPDARPADVLGSERDGGFAEFVVVPAACAHAVDGSPLSDVELAALPIAYGTALGMLDRGSVAAGHTVLVTGSSGGVGLAVVQLASALGARVVAVCSGDKAAAVREAGASVTVDRRRGAVREGAAAAAPRGYDAVIDVVAGPLIGRGLGLLRPGGRWVVAGALDGWAVDLDVRELYLGNLALVGSTMHTPRIFERLVDLARHGVVRPLVAETFALDSVAEAQRQLARREHVGKLVVVP